MSTTHSARFPCCEVERDSEAARQIAAAYEWASCPNRFRDYAPDKPHCDDREIQEQALAWFDLYLKYGLRPQTKQ